MSNQNEEHLNHAPLHGVVLCCTSIPPEERHAMAQVAEQMGATHKLDLTSDITHLIVGNIETPKYKYTAKERPDIKVLHPSWLEAVRASWMEGGETDVGALEVEHRLPTFFGLQICVTGFDNMDQRSDIQQKVGANGAQYHGDLTKSVTHLIAAHPTGKKYEYAGQWRIKVVSIEWLQDSLERGMALDETLYHPLLPVEQRGVGAVSKSKASPSLGKRTRQDTQTLGASESSRRKLRRTASTRLESQNDDLWADMGKTNMSFVSAPEEQFMDKSEGSSNTLGRESVDVPKDNAHVHIFKQSLPGITSRPTSAGQSEGRDSLESKRPSHSVFNPSGETDSEEALYIHGFDERKAGILHKFLVANGAVVLTEEDLEERGSIQQRRVTFVVPHDVDRDLVVAELIYFEKGDSCVTDFWVEKCLHHKTMVDRETISCRPFRTSPIDGFEKLTICPTSFAGIELLHFSKTVKLMGAMYDEFLKKETSVLVCNDTSLNQEKLKYAIENNIPVVSAEWLWLSIGTGEVLRFQDFALSGSRQSQNSTQPCFYHPEDNPRPKMKRNEQHKLVRSASGRPVKQQLEFCSEPAPPKPASQPRQEKKQSEHQVDPDNDFAPRRRPASKKPPEQQEDNDNEYGLGRRQPLSQPLRELPQEETNSPRKSSQRSQTRPHDTDMENYATIPDHQDFIPPPPSPPQKPSTPPSPHHQARKSPTKSPTKSPRKTSSKSPSKTHPSPSQTTTTLQTAIAHLLFHQQKAFTAPQGTIPQPRRHRPLGRASSNPSSLGASALSRRNSAAATGSVAVEEEQGEDEYYDGEEEEEARTKAQARSFQPSQALGYEDLEAVAVRESLMKGVVDMGEEDGMRRVQGIGRVVDEGGGGVEGGRRRRGRRAR